MPRRWLYVAAEHCEEVNKVLMKDLNVSKVEIEELWTFVKKTFPSMNCKPENERWIWLSFAMSTD